MLRIAIVGPGRVGTALARGFRAGGADVLGFVGRDAARTTRAVAALGAGRALTFGELARAHVVVFAVGDEDLAGAVAAARAGAPGRPCSLWLHTSGRAGLDVFAGIDGIRRGSLHPVAPFGERASAEPPRSAIAVIDGEPRALRLLRRLCTMLGWQPLRAQAGDRVLYHAACALAANGATALCALAETAFVRSGVVDAAAARRLTASLVEQASAACGAVGPAAALSGPVRRGDAATVALHLARLGDGRGDGAENAAVVYGALARVALELAREAGLAAEAAAGIRAVLQERWPRGSHGP